MLKGVKRAHEYLDTSERHYYLPSLFEESYNNDIRQEIVSYI